MRFQGTTCIAASLALAACVSGGVVVPGALPIAAAHDSETGDADDPGVDTAAPDAWPLARGTVAGTGRSGVSVRLPLDEAWRREFVETGFTAVPVIAEGRVFLGDLDGTFSALDLESGATLWSASAEDAGFTAAAAASSDPTAPLVVVGDDAGVVRAFDQETGRLVWQFQAGGEVSGGPTILTTGDRPRVLVGAQDAVLSCLDLAEGSVVWTHTINDQIRCSPTIARVADQECVLLAGCDGTLHLIDALSGEPAAGVAIEGPTGTTPAVAGGRALVGTEGGLFLGIDLAAARVAWRVATTPAGQAYRSSAAVADGLAIVGSRGRAVEAFSIDSGTRVWRQPTRGRVDASPAILTVVEDGREPRTAAVVADATGAIMLLDATDGTPLWQFAAGGGFAGGAAVASGRLVLASEGGSVWCFRTTAP